MTSEQIQEMLKEEYTINLSGGHVAYILKLLAMEQEALNEDVEENVTDAMAHALAAANDIVGNTLLHEAYRVCGPNFLAFAMNVEAKAIDRLMQSKTPEEVKKAGEEISKQGKKKPRKDLN